MADVGKMDRNLALEAVRVTEAAALAASKLMGRGDEKKADQAAVDAMRSALNTLSIDGTVVIGEGERDEAPMLYIGEKVGSGGPKIDIAAGRRSAPFGIPTADLRDIPGVPIERHQGAYYIRLMVVDQPGVIADVAAALRDEQVSMESMIQRGRAPGEAVPVVMTTHVAVEAAMRRALKRIEALDTVLEAPRMIRIEDF